MGSEFARDPEKEEHMDGKSVVITGASDGIGRELAVAFAKRGALVVVAARSASGLADTVRTCVAAGGRAVAVPTDVADPAACRELIDRAVALHGGIDVLVNNAGISMQSRFEDVTDLAVFERIMRVNYLGAVQCTHAALPHLRARRGLVAAVSSWQGKTGFPTYSAYAASKHALQGFFDSLRIELAGSGVDVLVVSPGPVDTAIHERRLGPDGAHHGGRPRAGTAMPVAECARQIVRAIDRRDRELVLTATGKALTWLRVAAPALLDRLIADAVRRFDADPGERPR
jgi:NAD(P)-dependent dehydrogenase (short-subunit alcohol dehydrogenase family)